MYKMLEYVGNMDQLLEVKNFRYTGGRADGVRAAQVTNQNGLQFTVTADRCMDISSLRYKGINISYINQCGVVSPQYCEHEENGWLRSFTAGFLTTCGLDNVGSPCEENSVKYGLHGRISNTPAEEYCARTEIVDGERQAVISGEMRQSVLFGEKLTLKREIRAYQREDTIEITDEISNMGFREEEFMILYHFNIGYPFLDKGCKLFIDNESVISRNQHSEACKEEMYHITEPDDLEEMCYYHKMNDRRGISAAGMYQAKFQIGFIVSYENDVLDKFIQWKNLSKGQYVMGLEPGSNFVDGKKAERSRDTIKRIGAQGKIKYKIWVRFYDGWEKFQKAWSGYKDGADIR